MKLGRLFLRLVVGGYFFAHGTQKLFGWFGGAGVHGTASMFESLGLRPGKRHATAAGLAETAGGTGLLLGAATPLASSVLIATMLTAIRTVHFKNGPWAANQGYEYNLVLIAAALALAETGPGSPSIDSARGRESHGLGTAALALGLGVAGAAGAQVISGFFPEPAGEPEPAPESAADPEPAPAPDPATAPEPDAPAAESTEPAGGAAG
jgi:putative oxidoreductase